MSAQWEMVIFTDKILFAYLRYRIVPMVTNTADISHVDLSC